MPQERSLTIQPPLAGINRKLGFQNQPPFTAIDIMNMWPFNHADGRRVLAARPNLASFTSPGSAVNMFAPVTSGGSMKPQEGLVAATGSDLFYWNGTGWTASGGAQASSVSTGRQVFASPLVNHLVIANDTNLLDYDYVTNSCATLVATAGSAPTNVRIIATHMGTIMVAGQVGNENVIFGSRTGVHTDWDYSQTDTGAAFSSDIETSGKVNEAVSALIPLTEDQMVIGCPNSMYIMRGHLSRGGQIDVLSPSIGILGNNAWCIDANGNCYFMSKSGFGVIDGNANSRPVLISDEKMPDQLRGIVYDYTNPNISMAYSARWNIIYIAVSGSQAQSWMYDIKSGGFQRMSFDVYPTVMFNYSPFVSFNKDGVLWGGTGYGGVARFDREGTETNRPFYHCFIGPIKLSENMRYKAMIKYARSVLGGQTNDQPRGAVVFYTGTDGEDAFLRAYNDLKSRRFGVNMATLLRNGGSCYPKLAGGALVIVFSGAGDKLAVLEHIDLALEDAGLNNDLRITGYGHFPSGIDNYDPGYGGGWHSAYGDDGKPKYKDGDGSWSDDDDDPYEGGFGPPTGGAGYIAITFTGF